MKRLFGRKYFDFKIDEYEPRKPSVNEVMVKVHACGVCGTDLHIVRSLGPDYTPLGHEISAEVIEVGEGPIPYKPGDKVIVEDVAQCGICKECKSGRPYLCRNMYSLNGQPGMSEILTVDYHLLDKFESMDWIEASLVEPLAVAYNTVLNSKIPPGGNVVVVGPGPIGLMCVRLSKMVGASRVILVGTSSKRPRGKARLEAGQKLGADYIIEADKKDAIKEVWRIFKDGADSVIVTSPPSTLLSGIRFAKYGGVVSYIGIDLGGNNKVEIDVNELIFNKKSLIPTFAEPAQNFPDAINIIEGGMLDTSLLVSTVFKIEDSETIFKNIESRDFPIIKAVMIF